MSVEHVKNEERRKRVFVGTLPDDFLRINNSSCLSDLDRQEAADAQAAYALQQQLVGVPYHGPSAVGRLNITVVQARLVKNYGLTRMDPYVRLRVGHTIFETNTDSNGGKTPKWNKDIQCLLPKGVSSMYIEIFDECSLTMDELVAWCVVPISPSILNGETCEDWFVLSGRQGEGLEGSINLVLSYTPSPYGYSSPTLTAPLSLPVISTVQPFPVAYTHPPVMAAPQPSALDLQQIEEMFPNMDKEVVKSVYEVNRYRKDLTVNSLLQIAD